MRHFDRRTIKMRLCHPTRWEFPQPEPFCAGYRTFAAGDEEMLSQPLLSVDYPAQRDGQ